MSTVPLSHSSEADYVWEVATLFPEQGEWSEEEYLRLTDGTNRRIEFTDGCLEFLSTPTEIHESMVEFLYFALREFVEKQSLGKVRWTGIRLRIRPRKIRLPDVIFLHKDHYHARHNRAWDGADLVMEVVSDDAKDRQRDYEQKLLDYAEAKVPEYWIIDYHRQLVLVHRLADSQYRLHGQFIRGQQATSALLSCFAVDVAALFAVADDVPE
jgi:Uma2 family endonuclease